MYKGFARSLLVRALREISTGKGILENTATGNGHHHRIVPGIRRGAAKTVHEIVSAGEKRIPGIISASATSHGIHHPCFRQAGVMREQGRIIDDERRNGRKMVIVHYV